MRLAAPNQTSEFDALGRKIYEVVDVSGDLNGNTNFLYNGQQIVEIRTAGGSSALQQFIHGTQYIDELVMMRRKDP